MITWYIQGPHGHRWDGRCSVDDDDTTQYIYYEHWPHDLDRGGPNDFHEPLESLLRIGKWIPLVPPMDPDLVMDEGL